MDDIFLTPDVTVDLTIRTSRSEDGNGVMRFTIEDGGPYKLRTATGREYGRIQQAYYKQDLDASYKLLRDHLVEGVPEDKIESIHPDLVWILLAEVLKRSRLSEVQRGK